MVSQTPIGQVLGSYRIEEMIGTGGFGAVYRARQEAVEREVAVKIIWPAFASHPNFIRKFEAEAQLVAGLEHPYIVPLYDYWRDPNGAYIVMRYLRGGALRKAMDEQEWSLNAIMRLIGQVGAALALAHRYGVVHRDIKPENILLDEENNAYLADFGIAQILSNAQDEADEFFGGMGSPAYAAPEQIVGGITSPQSDVYSLGLILYELLAGAHPFPELERLSSTQLVQMRATASIPPLRNVRADLPQRVDEVLQRATAVDPGSRFADILSFNQALEEAMGSMGRIYTGIAHKTDDLLPNPYKGLRAFQETDAPNFFGREPLVQRLLQRLASNESYHRFLAVIGPSGSGKSSLVKAGVIPQLRRGGLPGSRSWFYEEIVPGATPFEEVANTLIGLAVTPPENLLQRLRTDPDAMLHAVNEVLPEQSELFLFIDQFEELFTLVEDDALITHFLTSLYNAVTAEGSRLRVVITIRADFYDRPLLQPILSAMVRERTEVVIPLTATQLERVIVEPSRRQGIMMDPALVSSMIAEVIEQPGSLPLLQYALSQLFEMRQGNLIALEAYQRLGGVRGALTRQADDLYEKLVPVEQEAVRQLFLRLITLGEGTEDTRRRAHLSEVMSIRDSLEGEEKGAVMRVVVERLGKARLLTFDQDPLTRTPTVEVAHEAIIREWGRLRNWLDESRNDVRMQRTLSSLAQEWVESQQEPSFLLRGGRLDSYERWVVETKLSLTTLEREYLDQSIAERKRISELERQREERERELERRSVNRLRLTVGVLLVATLVAVGLSAIAISASNRASEEAEVAQSIAWEAGAISAQEGGDGDLAVLLALQANDMGNPPVQSVSALSQVAFSPGTRAILEGHDAWVTAVDIHQPSNLLASASTDFTVRLWDLQTQQPVFNDGEPVILNGHSGDVEDIVFSPDGNLLASVSIGVSRNVILWDMATFAIHAQLEGHSDNVRTVAFSPDGSLLATGSKDKTVILWEVATGQQRHQFFTSNDPANPDAGVQVSSLTFSPDGSILLVGTTNGEIYAWELASAALLWQVDSGDQGGINALAFHPQQATIFATGSGGGSLALRNLTDGSVIQRFRSAIADEIRDFAFSPDGTYLYSASVTSVVRVWDVETGLEVDQLQGHEQQVLAAAISEDGQLLASGSKDDSIRLWNVGQPAAEQILQAHTGRVTGIVARGDRLYSAAVDNQLLIWERGATQPTLEIEVSDSIRSLAISPDGNRALWGTPSGSFAELDLQTQDIILPYPGHSSSVNTLAYLPDGQQALSAGQDGLMILWDLQTGQEIRRYSGHTSPIFDLALAPDGTHAATASTDGTAIYWNLQTGEIMQQFQREEGEASPVYAVAISPDAATLVTGSLDGYVILWDLATGVEQTRYVGDAGAVWTVRFSSDGQRLLSATEDGVVFVWDLASNEDVQRFTVDDAVVYELATFEDGRNIVSGQDDGSLVIWRTYPLSALQTWLAQNRYVRPLTCIEHEQYRFPDDVPCESRTASDES